METYSATLGRVPLAHSWSIELAATVEDTTRSHTFAIVGAWGSGKSWLLDALLANLKSQEDWSRTHRVVRFDPWFYSDEESLFAGFSGLLVQQTLQSQNARKKVANLLRFVGPSAKFGPVDASGLVKNIGNAIDGAAPQQIQKAIAQGLAEAHLEVLIVMDDLDRLTPSELLTLFKLVRLVGDIPGLSYLFAYDEVTLQHLLEQTPIAQRSPDRARRYLEKIVEHKWSVPPLTLSQTEALVLNRLPRWGRDPEGGSGLGYRLESLIPRAIQTPRAAERFVEKVYTVNAHLFEELHGEDLYLALFLMTFAPTLWDLVVDGRELLVGRQSYAFEREIHTERAKDLRRRMLESVQGQSYGNDLVDLLIGSFPAFEAALGDTSRSTPSEARIGNPDFIDHYLWLEIPPGAVRERDMRRLISELPSEPAIDALDELLRGAPRLTLASLERNGQRSVEDSISVVHYLEHVYRAHGIEGEVSVFATVDNLVATTTASLLSRLDGESLSTVVGGGAVADRALIRHILRVHPRGYTADYAQWAEGLNERLAEEILETLRDAAAPTWTNEATRNDLSELRRINKAAYLRVVSSKVETGVWDPLDVATVYVVLMLSSSDGYRLSFGDGEISELSDQAVAMMRAAASGAYPEEWGSDGPGEFAWPIGNEVMREAAAFGLANPGGLNVRVTDVNGNRR